MKYRLHDLGAVDALLTIESPEPATVAAGSLVFSFREAQSETEGGRKGLGDLTFLPEQVRWRE